MRPHAMIRFPRPLRAPLALAALFHLIAAVAAATAQTVIVTKAPAGTPIELGLNGAAVVSGPIGVEGWVTLDTKWAGQRKPGEETPVTIYVDVCEDSRRVMLVEPGQQPLGSRAGCARRAVPGVYVMRALTTFVVEATDSPSVRLRQSSVPRS